MGKSFCIEQLIVDLSTRIPFLLNVNVLPDIPGSWRDYSQITFLDWEMINSDSMESSTSCSSRLFSSRFFFCAGLDTTELLWSWFLVQATTITYITSSGSALFTPLAGCLDSASAACCFAPALCTIMRSYSNNRSLQFSRYVDEIQVPPQCMVIHCKDKSAFFPVQT